MRILIKNGQIIDPGHFSGTGDILVENGRIAVVGAPLHSEQRLYEAETEIDRIIDATGKWVVPGLVDMHVHLREPGEEHKETIATGSQAAVAGGFTAVCAMPNTHPVNDQAVVTAFIQQQARQSAKARVYPVGALTRDLEGKLLSDYFELRDAGVVALTDDGRPVANTRLMRRAMEYAASCGLPVISHCEELDLAAGGVMNEGVTATRMGLAGIPNAAESIMVLRDLALCELTGAPLHIAHVSTAESVRAIAAAKKMGLPVTAETAPHYFTLTEAAVADYNTHAKMNPPLRTEADRQAICQGLADGTLDVIATDHAPHAVTDKEVTFDEAANGIVGLESALALSLTLVAQGLLSIEQLIGCMSVNPARILGLPQGLKTGLPADLTIIDPQMQWQIDADAFYSKGRNTPFDGRAVTGRAVLTMVQGGIVFELV